METYEDGGFKIPKIADPIEPKWFNESEHPICKSELQNNEQVLVLLYNKVDGINFARLFAPVPDQIEEGGLNPGDRSWLVIDSVRPDDPPMEWTHWSILGMQFQTPDGEYI